MHRRARTLLSVKKILISSGLRNQRHPPRQAQSRNRPAPLVRERHFARGDVIKVAPGMDLVDAALHVAENNAATVQEWLADGRIARAELADAEDWHARQPMFWQ